MRDDRDAGWNAKERMRTPADVNAAAMIAYMNSARMGTAAEVTTAGMIPAEVAAAWVIAAEVAATWMAAEVAAAGMAAEVSAARMAAEVSAAGVSTEVTTARMAAAEMAAPWMGASEVTAAWMATAEMTAAPAEMAAPAAVGETLRACRHGARHAQQPDEKEAIPVGSHSHDRRPWFGCRRKVVRAGALRLVHFDQREVEHRLGHASK
jgi:hypothetical protein